MIDPELLEILCCPETRQTLVQAEAAQVAGLNRELGEGKVRNRAGKPVTEPISGLLIREDGCFGYLVRDTIPIMLIDEAVPLSR